jgi:hypothetical protein
VNPGDIPDLPVVFFFEKYYNSDLSRAGSLSLGNIEKMEIIKPELSDFCG